MNKFDKQMINPYSLSACNIGTEGHNVSNMSCAISLSINISTPKWNIIVSLLVFDKVHYGNI